MKSLLLILIFLPSILFSQFSFESYHVYKVVTPESTEYCYDYIPDGFVDVQDLMFIILWYGNNEMNVMDFLNFVADWNSGACDILPIGIFDYEYFEQTSTGAIFTYPDSSAELLWTKNDEFDNLTTCDLVCVNSFIYLW